MARPEDRLALISLLDREGRAVRSWDVHAWPVALGRALDQHVVLDDASVAAQHALLSLEEDGQVRLTVGPTSNGLRLNGHHLAAGQQRTLPAGAQRPAMLELGLSKLRLRLREEALAPEVPLPAHLLPRLPGRPALWNASLNSAQLALVAAGLMASLLLKQWLSLDPGADLTTWLPALVGLPAAVMAWCGTWALLSKLFQQRFEFGAHLQVALPGLLIIEVLDTALPLLAASLGWPWLWRINAPLRTLLMAWVIYRHLALLMPQQTQRAAVALVAATVVGGAISLAFTHRNTDRFSAPPYMSTLPLPLINATRSVPSSSLVQQLQPLSEQLQRRADKARKEGDEDGEAED